MTVFNIENKTKFIKWFVINLLIVFGVYNLCSSHEAVERKSRKSRLSMNYYQKMEYRNRLYCSLSPVILHLFSFKTPILEGKKIRKNVKSIVGISPTMVLLFHLPFVYLKM